MGSEINFCIIGLGRAGQIHQNSLSVSPGLRLHSVVDPHLSETTIKDLDHSGIQHFEQLENALKEEALEAVIVSSPTAQHFDHITQALTAGKHVFAEKPIGKSQTDIHRCYELSLDKQRCLYLGFQRRYDQSFRALKENLSKIAPVRMLKASSRDNPQPSIDYLKISGNIFHDMLIHDFDMLINLLGPKIPLSVYAAGHAYDQEIAAIPDYDTVMVSFKYEDGMICSIDTSRSAVYGYDQRLEVFGAQGMLRIDNQRDHNLQWDSPQGTTTAPIKHSFPQRYQDSYIRELQHFAEGIRQGPLHNIPEDESVLSHLMAEAAFQALRENRVVNFQSEYGNHLKST